MQDHSFSSSFELPFHYFEAVVNSCYELYCIGLRNPIILFHSKFQCWHKTPSSAEYVFSITVSFKCFGKEDKFHFYRLKYQYARIPSTLLSELVSLFTCHKSQNFDTAQFLLIYVNSVFETFLENVVHTVFFVIGNSST